MNLRLSWRKNWPDVEALLRGGFPSFVTARDPEPRHEEGVPVFCYHAAKPDVIEADFRFLVENGYRVWSADDLMRSMRGEVVAGVERAVVLTVDDGAFDLYGVLYPMLRKFDLRMTAFVAPAFHADHYDLADDRRPCTWGELREMQASGLVDVQAHTFSHRYIPNWPEPLDLVGIDQAYSRGIQAGKELSLEDDLEKAKEVLEQRTGTVIRHMAFPMYRGTDDAIRTGQRLGYEGFWWGTRPGRRGNRPGDPVEQVVRMSAEFVRRLPGEGRVRLREVWAGKRKHSPYLPSE